MNIGKHRASAQGKGGKKADFSRREVLKTKRRGREDQKKTAKERQENEENTERGARHENKKRSPS